MSKYTTELRYICESYAGLSESVGLSRVDDIITAALPLLFDFDFPIWDNAYKPVLERKIVQHYYTREICAETVGLWKMWLKNKLQEIMPYYNQLYASTLIDYNPLNDVDYTKTGNTEQASTGNTTASERVEETNDVSDILRKTGNDTKTIDETVAKTSEFNGEVTTADQLTETTSSQGQTTNQYAGTSGNAFSDTPNSKLTDVDELNYLSSYAKVVDENSSNGTAQDSGSHNATTNRTDNTSNEASDNTDTDSETVFTHNTTDARTIEQGKDKSTSATENKTLNSTEEYLERVTGYHGAHMLSTKILEYRKTLLNIDLEIIKELNDLFFGLW